jgi:hypothetical protein
MTKALGGAVGLGLRPRTGAQNKLRDKVLNVLWVGQSNASRMFTQFSGAGNTAFIDALDAYYPTVNTINGAGSGIAIHKDADTGAGYFWDYDAGTPGPALLDALDAVDNAGIARKNIDVVVIVHGEKDSEALHSSTISEAECKSALLSYISYLRTELHNPLILLTPIGANKTSSQFTGYGIMRRIIWQIWQEQSHIHETPGFWDLPYDDNLHLTQAGYEAFAGRTARRILALLNKISVTGTLGPRVSAVTFSPTADRVYVTIAHDGGTDYTLTERRGKLVTRNGTGIAPTAISKTNSTSFEMNPSTNLQNGDVITFTWIWGTMQGYTNANVLRDNTANNMPLRMTFDFPATQIT